MDKTIRCKEDDVEKLSQSETSETVQSGGVEMEEANRHSPQRTDEPDVADEELAERPQPEGVLESGDNLCTICGFSAKCPRSLKIHNAKKHGKKSKNTIKTTAAQRKEDIVRVSPAEVQQNVDVEESDFSGQKSAASDNSKSTKSLIQKQDVSDKQQTNQEETGHSRERRVSKRTPKPKMIFSCNYCGQEFRDQAPLDVHVQRYHVKDTPYTCEYMRISASMRGETKDVRWSSFEG